MKRTVVLILSILIFSSLKAQTDTSMHATAVQVCDCLGKSNITDSSSATEMQQAFMNCIMKSPDFLSKLMTAGGDMEASEELATQLGMEMMKINCPVFLKIAMGMSGGTGGMEFSLPSLSGDEQSATETTDGTVINVEEKDFLYLTVKTSAGRELNFIYYSYVPGSDDWIKDPAKIKNKKVSLSYTETEVYQPKFKQFMNVKQIKTLTIQ